MQFNKLPIIMALVAIFLANAQACTTLPSAAENAYFVSGVMSLKTAPENIKLVQAVVREQTEVAALEAFVKAALVQYPDFKMALVQASKEGTAACQKPGATVPAARLLNA